MPIHFCHTVAARAEAARLLSAAGLLACLIAPRPVRAQRFELSYPATATPTGAPAVPITGRAFVFVARTDRTEPRLQSGSTRRSEPFFGVDVEALGAGRTVMIDATTPGFPLASLKDLPAGDYFVQGLLVPYTQFRRSDGHTVWAHMDAGEGQRFNDSPGSLVSEVRKVRIDRVSRSAITLSLTKTIPPVTRPRIFDVGRAVSLRKFAIWLAPTLKSPKL